MPGILYIFTEDHLSTFYLLDNQKYTCSKSLNEIAPFLPDYFLQINRSCIVNMNEIKSFRRKSRKIILRNSVELIVSMRRMKTFNETFANQNIAFAR